MGRTRRPKRLIGRLGSGELREAKFRFKKEARSELVAVLCDRLGVSAKATAVSTFVRAAELALAGFSVYRELEKERPHPRLIEANIEQIKRHASVLKKALDAMDTDTRFHLELSLQAPMFHLGDAAMPKLSPGEEPTVRMIEVAKTRRLAAEAFISRVIQDLGTLAIASAVAATAPRHAQSGRPKEHWRVELATEIARAFRECLKVQPTTTHDGDVTTEGPFVAVLRICLNAAGVYVKDVHRLAMEAVKRVKVQEPE
jgi:hypothetical protein